MLWSIVEGGSRSASADSSAVLLTQLQRADVSDDGPTILHGNLRGVRRHCAPAVSDSVEEVAHRRLAEAIFVERSGFAEPATHDHAVAVSGHTVTNAAEDLVTLAAA